MQIVYGFVLIAERESVMHVSDEDRESLIDEALRYFDVKYLMDDELLEIVRKDINSMCDRIEQMESDKQNDLCSYPDCNEEFRVCSCHMYDFDE